MKQFLNILFLNLLLILIFACNKSNDNSLKINQSFNDTVSVNNSIENDKLISIVMVGDIMLGTNYPSNSSLPPDDGKFILKDAAPYLSNADLTIGNLEGTLLNKGGTPKVCANPGNCVSFRMPEHYASYLKDAGFDLLNLANNHSGDMGDIGRESTRKTLDKYGIKYAGHLVCPKEYISVDGIKYGFAGFAPNVGTVSIHNLSQAKEIVAELRKNSDVVIITFHGGAEGGGAIHVNRKQEFYLGENRGNVFEFARNMIDSGADIVFGHGPHVPRGIELYKNKIIAYSLGNFCTYAKFGLSGYLGLAPILKIYINKNGDFQKGEIIPFKQINKGIPVFDKDYGAVKLIKRISKEDFPESKLEINDSGLITIKK